MSDELIAQIRDEVALTRDEVARNREAYADFKLSIADFRPAPRAPSGLNFARRLAAGPRTPVRDRRHRLVVAP